MLTSREEKLKQYLSILKNRKSRRAFFKKEKYNLKLEVVDKNNWEVYRVYKDGSIELHDSSDNYKEKENDK